MQLKTRAAGEVSTPRSTLRAEFLRDETPQNRGLYRGARCELPSGEVVEVTNRKTPLYDLARKLDALGYGDCHIQAFTPQGTPSLRGLVKKMAKLIVTERDKAGLRLERYRPFPVRRQPIEGDLGSDGASSTRNGRNAPQRLTRPRRSSMSAGASAAIGQIRSRISLGSPNG